MQPVSDCEHLPIRVVCGAGIEMGILLENTNFSSFGFSKKKTSQVGRELDEKEVEEMASRDEHVVVRNENEKLYTSSLKSESK